MGTESVGFEPTCPMKDNRISSAARYGLFANSPCEHKFTVLIFYNISSHFSILILPQYSSLEFSGLKQLVDDCDGFDLDLGPFRDGRHLECSSGRIGFLKELGVYFVHGSEFGDIGQ